jgi:hypothetical protein
MFDIRKLKISYLFYKLKCSINDKPFLIISINVLFIKLSIINKQKVIFDNYKS